MAVNNEAAQLVIGAAILSQKYRKMLLTNRTRALAEVVRHEGVPSTSRLSADDQNVLGAIQARTLPEFARGVLNVYDGSLGSE